jgi:hypothetical protein
MTIALADALSQLELEPGRTYRCQVKGRWVELRVLEGNPPELAKPYSMTDVMLDPWVELPGPTATTIVRARVGIPLPFDVPYISDDAEQP